jgi:predicted naringenin-chalcone synthase
MTTAYINRIATAVPQHDVHQAFISFASTLLPEGTLRNLFGRMARLSAIEHRYSFIDPIATQDGYGKMRSRFMFLETFLQLHTA